MKTLLIVLLLFISLAADKLVCPKDNSIKKNSNGFFVIPLCKWEADTFYKGKLKWGDGWAQYDGEVPAGYVVIRSQGVNDTWEYETKTDINGSFLLPVRDGHDFKLSASHGSGWADYNETLPGIPAGTTKE